ncbi:MAG: hypothetical protein ACE5FW_03525 [Candidatus Aenigmatarchaeota archaeon]
MPEIQTFRFEYKVPENIADFDPQDFIAKAEAWLAGHVRAGEKVALSASGGVDSTVAGLLTGRVVGENLYPFFIEDGCRRLILNRPESRATERIFKDYPNFTIYHAVDRVLSALTDLSKGEEKREAFISQYKEVSDSYIQRIGADWVADGTIGPDIRETEGGFKSQHNVGWGYSVRKLEPLASLAKPQVRKVAMALGLPEEFAHRIPCPGPAQIVRTVGRFTMDKLKKAQTATDIVEQLVERYYAQKMGQPYQYDEQTGVRTPFQYFGCILDSGMDINTNFTDLASSVLRTESRGFVMDAQTTTVPPGGERPEKPIYKPVAWLETKDEVGYEELDELSRQAQEQLDLPRILCRVFESDGSYFHVAAIRVVESADAKTARAPRIERAYLHDMGKAIREGTKIARAAYDLGPKPWSTIEFE